MPTLTLIVALEPWTESHETGYRLDYALLELDAARVRQLILLSEHAQQVAATLQEADLPDLEHLKLHPLGDESSLRLVQQGQVVFPSLERVPAPVCYQGNGWRIVAADLATLLKPAVVAPEWENQLFEWLILTPTGVCWQVELWGDQQTVSVPIIHESWEVPVKSLKKVGQQLARDFTGLTSRT